MGNLNSEFKKLVRILKTDKYINSDTYSPISIDIDVIITKNTRRVQEHHQAQVIEKARAYVPQDEYLFHDSIMQTIYDTNIKYNSKPNPTSFFELFDIKLNQYTIDNYRANSCLITLIVDRF